MSTYVTSHVLDSWRPWASSVNVAVMGILACEGWPEGSSLLVLGGATHVILISSSVRKIGLRSVQGLTYFRNGDGNWWLRVREVLGCSIYGQPPS